MHLPADFRPHSSRGKDSRTYKSSIFSTDRQSKPETFGALKKQSHLAKAVGAKSLLNYNAPGYSINTSKVNEVHYNKVLENQTMVRALFNKPMSKQAEMKTNF